MPEIFNDLTEIYDEIVSIEYIGEEDTIDINTDGNRLFYANNILTHNSAVEEIEFDHSHISGGLSKIQTADNVFGIFTSRAMRERGRYQIQLMKTRSSSGVGNKIDLAFDVDTLRISDCDDIDEDATANNSTGNSGSSIVNAIKRGSSSSTAQEETAESKPTGKVRAEADSTKLRQFLNNLGGDDD